MQEIPGSSFFYSRGVALFYLVRQTLAELPDWFDNLLPC